LVPFSLLDAIGDWLRPASVPAIQSRRLAGAMVKMADPFSASPQPSESFSIAFSHPAAATPHHCGALLEIVWLCGALFLFLSWSRGWWSIRSPLRSASRIFLPMEVPVFLTSRMIGPAIVGILRPVLLLPER